MGRAAESDESETKAVSELSERIAIEETSSLSPSLSLNQLNVSELSERIAKDSISSPLFVDILVDFEKIMRRVWRSLWSKYEIFHKFISITAKKWILV